MTFNSTKKQLYRKAELLCNGKLIPINVHHSEDLISKYIINYHAWEETNLNNLFKVVKNLDFHFIDIGCNLGVYSLNMGCRGHDVIAVDANIENINRLTESISLNSLTDKIVVLHNALSDSHQNFQIKSNHNNIGSAKAYHSKNNHSMSVQGIVMDDLVPLLKHKTIVIKIDIEGSEVRAFKRSSLLFKMFKVAAVFIEWQYLLLDPDVTELIHLFIKHKLRPYSHEGIKLLLMDYKNWPFDVIWKIKLN